MWWRRGGERWRHSVPSTTTHILHTAANATDERALAASIDALSTAGTYLATDSHGMVARSISREKRKMESSTQCHTTTPWESGRRSYSCCRSTAWSASGSVGD